MVNVLATVREAGDALPHRTRAAPPIVDKDRIAILAEPRLVAAEDRLGEFDQEAAIGNAAIANCGSLRHRPEIVALGAAR